MLPFTFNRLEADNEPDLDKVMNNTIESLKAALQNETVTRFRFLNKG